MAETPKTVAVNLTTSSETDLLDISGEAAGSWARIISITISNGTTAGTLTLRQYQTAYTSSPVVFANALPIVASGSMTPATIPRIYDILLIRETSSKITGQSATSTGIAVKIDYILYTP